MTDLELITHLKSLNKPYNSITPVMPQSTFSTTVIRFETGLLKPNTLAEFAKRFGFIKVGQRWVQSPRCYVCDKPLDIQVVASVYYCELHGPGI